MREHDPHPLAEEIHDLIADLDKDERKTVFADLFTFYCRDCGAFKPESLAKYMPGGQCPCNPCV